MYKLYIVLEGGGARTTTPQQRGKSIQLYYYNPHKVILIPKPNSTYKMSPRKKEAVVSDKLVSLVS